MGGTGHERAHLTISRESVLMKERNVAGYGLLGLMALLVAVRYAGGSDSGLHQKPSQEAGRHQG